VNPVEARFKYLIWLSRLQVGHQVIVEMFNRDLTQPAPGTQYPGTVVHKFIDSEKSVVRYSFQDGLCDNEFILLSDESYQCGIGPYVGYHPAPLFVILPLNTHAVHSTFHPWYFWPEGEYEI
jgi:hypothetical protein